MSLRAYRWARQVEVHVPRHVRPTLLALADRHNDQTGQLNPSVATLATMVGASVRAVQRHLSWLEAAGLIDRSKQGVKGTRNTSTHYLLSFDRASPVSPTVVTPTSPLEPGRGTGKTYRTSSCVDRAVDDQRQTETEMGMNEGGYEDIWGSAQSRQSEDDRQQSAAAKRDARRARAQARAETIALRPRSAWGPGDLAEFFKARALSMGRHMLPRLPFPPEIRGGFAELLTKGATPAAVADSIETFFDTESLWSEPLSRGAELWRVYMAQAVSLVESATPAETYDDDVPLGGRSW